MAVSTIVDALLERAEQTPDALAFGMDSDTISYGRLRDDVLRMAGVLEAAGIDRGDRCALLLPTGLDFIRTLFAAQLAGAIPVPLNPTLPDEAIIARFGLIRCSLAIVDPPALDRLTLTARGERGPRLRTPQDLRSAATMPVQDFALPRPDDPALLFLTPGTSGEPRAGIRLHRSLMAAVRSRLRRLDVRASDVFVGWIPLYHTMGLSHFIAGPLVAGCPASLVPPAIANLRAWLQTIARVRATITSAPDFGYRAAATIDASDLDLTSLRVATSGSEPVRLETIDRFERRFGVPGVIRPLYGLSEAGAVTVLAPGEPLRADANGHVSCGRPLDGIELEIVDADGRVRKRGVAGEIRLRGDQVFAGYFDDEAATDAKLRDGWLYTGDTGALDADGHLYVLGRLRTLIKRGGTTIAPRELEEAAERVDGILLAAAVGVPGASGPGTEDVVIVAEAERDAGSSPDDPAGIVRAICDHIVRESGFTPTRVIIVTPGTVPRTSNGKVRHDELKRLVIEGALAHPSTGSG